MPQVWLYPLSWLYGQAIGWRRAWLQQTPPQRLGAPVISVGNITVGGTGKTEAVVMVCWILRSLGVKPAVLSRGYGRQSRDKILVVSDGSGPLVTARAAGDEPYLLASRLTQVPVVVSTDRIAAGELALRRLGCQALVLDDGFQRRDQVYRDLDLVLLDAGDAFGQDRVLPAGRLREPLTALQEANALIITRADQYDPAPVLQRLATLAPDIPCFTARHAATGLTPLGQQGERQSLEFLKNKKIIAFSGIARPEAFLQTLQAQGAVVVEQIRFRDHHWFSSSEQQRIRERAQALGCEIVTTSKDAARLSASALLSGWSLDVDFKMINPPEGLLPLVEQCLKQFRKKTP